MMQSWLDELQWNADGLVPAIAQDIETGDILMMAWVNREALNLTKQKGQVTQIRSMVT